MEHLQLTVPPEHDGSRLDRFLAATVPQHSRAQIQRLIKAGAVQVGRRAVKSNTLVRAEDQVHLELPDASPSVPRAEALPIDIVYQDLDIVVVDKPAGMVVHPAAGHADGTLVNALLHHVSDLSGIGGEVRPGIVHRLDKGTSGLMVIAKNDAAHQALSAAFQHREIEKEYAALVWGRVEAGKRIDAAIGRDPGDRKKMSSRARRARAAVTRIVRVEALRGVTLAHVVIQTGRTHQIRVHLSAIGHAVVGDALYGGVRRQLPGDLRAIARLERPFLHAARLAFRHPRDGRPLSFERPMPTDLESVLDDIRRAQAPSPSGARRRDAARH